ncbi:MAG: TAT-variant-translocated molybdopterin oxidoreductase, partial [Candidatus Wallbacteria bacterium]|nr:TAT-variant-translocated molybdopterin oxidoreductase [Candidatus Wallbacteria bacterium]
MTHPPKDARGAVRAALARKGGRELWRSLDELAGTPAFEQLLADEFPRQASEPMDAVSRRKFLGLMGASLALGGLSGCIKQPLETIVPYVRPPEQLVPGTPLFFATAATLGGYATGILVESHEGRPTKIEGNPDHPASLGAVDAFTQASILSLYDPDRSQVVTHDAQISTWDALLAELEAALAAAAQDKGARLRLLTGTVTSPTMARQLELFLARFPAARWHQYEPVNRDNSMAGARLAFGEPLAVLPRLDAADVILALDCDFLACGPGHIRATRDFAAKRQPVAPGVPGNRLYALESSPTVTGAKADHRLPLRPGQIDAFARHLAQKLGIAAAGEPPALDEREARWLDAIATDLTAQGRRGHTAILAGEQLPPAIHALVHAANDALGNFGSTLFAIPPVEHRPENQTESLRRLVTEMMSGTLDTVIVLGGNPIYDAPADLHFAEALSRVKRRFRFGLYEDETSAACQWHGPETHYLESWSDARAFDGTVSLVQPLIAPLYSGRSAHEVLAILGGQAGQSSHDLVKSHWKSQASRPDFEAWWQKALHDGLIRDSAPAQATPKLALGTLDFPEDQGRDLELLFRADPTIYDGRFANNGWLQELPKPLTKLTWDNAALIAPATARKLGLASEDAVTIELDGRTVRAPVFIVPGHCEGALTLHLGYGRWQGGRSLAGAGFNAYALRSTAAPWNASGAHLARTGERWELACTQLHQNMKGRDLVRVESPAQANDHGHHAGGEGHHPSIYPPVPYPGYAWGMAIDLNSCVGCNSCVVACQSENNIPVVGKDQVIRGREMHWIRVDTYHEGPPENPRTYHQPVPCMHCENAPCEVVCPVGATSHSEEGLNDMAYNRCVGTKYCSNNCPYKVRRFNFLQYSDYETPSLKMLANPNVTVRSLGVMEKCTFCVQRINAGRIKAEKEDRRVTDGEIVSA